MAIRSARERRVPLAVFVIGTAGSGKSSVCAGLSTDRWSLFHIDDYYRDTPRTNTRMEWADDESYRRGAYRAMKADVLRALRDARDVIIETTGASVHTASLFRSLARRKGVRTLVLHVKVSLANARARVRARNRSAHPIKCRTAFLAYAARVIESTSLLPIDYTVNGNDDLASVRREVRAILGRSRAAIAQTRRGPAAAPASRS
jgi:adenylate kinase family enzyme